MKIPAVRFIDVSKYFGSIVANRSVSFDIQPGSIHSVIGENGAGKSTIMKILFGFYTADSGRIQLFGNDFEPKDPTDAILNGIGMVHQHFMLIPTMTVIENIMLGFERSNKLGQLELKKMAETVRQFSETYNMPIDPFETVDNLPVGQRQRVEIIKALYRKAEILILDEPTAVLTPKEVQHFFDILRRLKKEGKTIILITHKLEEVLKISDRITVMRNGGVVGETNSADATVKSLAGIMVGRDVLMRVSKKSPPKNRRILEVSSLSGQSDADIALKNVDFFIREGEIFGIVGISGNGQTTLEEILNGSLPATSGAVTLNETDITRLGVRQRKEKKIAHVPSDREKHGFIGQFPNMENLYLGYHYMEKFSTPSGFLKRNAIREHATKAIEHFDIRPPNPDTHTETLSGGNKQKIVIAREFSQNPIFLIVSEPTRGVDIGAIEYIHNYILKLKKEGKAILLISSDLTEVCTLSDRACVMYQGEISGYFDPRKMNENDVGMLMSGGIPESKPILSHH